MRGVATSIPVGLDHAAADAANAEGKPYRWRDSCGRTYVRVRGSPAKWVLPASATAQGQVPSTKVLGYRGGSGVERPTGEGTVLPGQTTAPATGAVR